MPFDLNDAEDNLPATTTTTTIEADAVDIDDCDGPGSAKRRRLDITVPECYGSPEDDTISKASTILLQYTLLFRLPYRLLSGLVATEFSNQ